MSFHTEDYTIVLLGVYAGVCAMVAKAKVKIYEVQGRHTLNLPSDLVKDSTFPFKSKEELVARIDGDRLIVEKPKRSS